MSQLVIRPAEPEDVDRAHETFPDLLPDRWREGGNRRSFVAVELPGPHQRPGGTFSGPRIVGHCRGVDNAAHPGSRVLLFETVARLHGTGTERDLLRTLMATSPLPLHSKVERKDAALCGLLASLGSTLVQLMPPWRYQVDHDLKAWARSALDAAPEDVTLTLATSLPAEDILALEVDHYIEQHEPWSPAAPHADLRDYLAEDHDPASSTSWNRNCSWAVTTRNGKVKAAALVWGNVGTDRTPSRGNDAPEISHLSRPHASPEAWTNKLLAIASVIRSVPLGTELCIDSHLSMRREFAAIGTIPGVDRSRGEWTAIVATSPEGAQTSKSLDPRLIPEAAAWTREFTGA